MIDRVLSPTPSFLARAQVALVRGQVVDGALAEPSFFIGGEPELEGIDDHTGETFLDRENILDGHDDQFRFEVNLVTGKEHIAGPKVRCTLKGVGTGKNSEGNPTFDYSGVCTFRG